MTKRLSVGLYAVATLVVCGSAQADVITETIDITATNILQLFGSTPSPTPPLSIDFTITFDPTQTYAQTTSGITLINTNISHTGSLSFKVNPVSNTLTVGTYATLGAPTASSSDFELDIQNPAGLNSGESTISLDFAIVNADGDNFYESASTFDRDPLTFTVSSGATDVPEPTTVALFTAGLVGMGALRRRFGWRRRNSAA